MRENNAPSLEKITPKIDSRLRGNDNGAVWDETTAIDRPRTDEEMDQLAGETLVKNSDGTIFKFVRAIKGGRDGKNAYLFQKKNGTLFWENLAEQDEPLY